MKAGSNFKGATDAGEQGKALAILYSRHGRTGWSNPEPVATRRLGGDRVPGRAPDCMKTGESNKPKTFLAEGLSKEHWEVF